MLPTNRSAAGLGHSNVRKPLASKETSPHLKISGADGLISLITFVAASRTTTDVSLRLARNGSATASDDRLRNNIPFLFSRGERGRENLITSGPLNDFYDQPHPHINRFQYYWDQGSGLQSKMM